VQKRIFSWQGREFIDLSSEARPAASVEEETSSLFRTFEQELKTHGLSLQNTVRTRLWGRDRDARNLATAARSKILTGSAKGGAQGIARQGTGCAGQLPCGVWFCGRVCGG
jgi:hypothetical protein